ncbi:hypothetical protein HH_0987 [Helicobacter hepaticus ATCC 51449]|uniref:Uncharacterized protein n=1 Tax=Helicobacter hepaticus (strain ATCC 51449 / 3B1) TaxID=235279 RepID=Q7VHI0_HELHP|nr:hypothetical protein HH_0987 [Helicobacter hepaticus ATCC 51449]
MYNYETQHYKLLFKELVCPCLWIFLLIPLSVSYKV